MRIDNRTDDPSLITVNANGEGATVGDALAAACAKANEAWSGDPWITVRQTRHGVSGDVWRVTLETISARVRRSAHGFELKFGDVIIGLADGSEISDAVAGKAIVDEPVAGTYLLADHGLWKPDPHVEFAVLRLRSIV